MSKTCVKKFFCQWNMLLSYSFNFQLKNVHTGDLSNSGAFLGQAILFPKMNKTGESANRGFWDNEMFQKTSTVQWGQIRYNYRIMPNRRPGALEIRNKSLLNFTAILHLFSQNNHKKKGALIRGMALIKQNTVHHRHSSYDSYHYLHHLQTFHPLKQWFSSIKNNTGLTYRRTDGYERVIASKNGVNWNIL